jgi:hypothetical protein
LIAILSILVLFAVAAWLMVYAFRTPGPFHGPDRFRLPQLWQWHGTVDRGTYALVGIAGFAIKHNIDRIVATVWFGRRFTPLNYWVAPVSVVRADQLSADDARFFAAMAAIALPFIIVGLTMTIRRLRSAGLPAALAVLFFIPVGNLIFFLLLCLAPARTVRTNLAAPERAGIGSFIPRDSLGSSALAVALTGSVGALATYIGVQALGIYGWGVFVALPFCLGLFSVFIYTYHEVRSLAGCVAVSAMSIGIVAAGLLAFAIEGFICIVMAIPIALPLALLGGFTGFMCQRGRTTSIQSPSTMLMVLLLPVGIMGSEALAASESGLVSVRTTIRIDAPAARVWQNLIAFPDIVQPPETLFKLGVSYPIRAAIHGQGPGAMRECVFSTGTFVEVINVWETGKRLGFSVLSAPEGMRELSPYDIHPRHLDGYFVPESAEFSLTTNPDGSTQLDGISWYRNRMWPSPYWRLWSDWILHRVHTRVFEHIRSLSENRS